jgi:hypothetical protein
VLLLTFVEYVAFIFPGVVSAHGKHTEPSRADTTPGKMKVKYSTNVSAQIQ